MIADEEIEETCCYLWKWKDLNFQSLLLLSPLFLLFLLDSTSGNREREREKRSLAESREQKKKIANLSNGSWDFLAKKTSNWIKSLHRRRCIRLLNLNRILLLLFFLPMNSMGKIRRNRAKESFLFFLIFFLLH